ncbi:MAG: hypothetical protein ACREQ5_13710, partial [Candidatus Dormibacteria bacterium]
ATVTVAGSPQSFTVDYSGSTYGAVLLVEVAGSNAIQNPVFVQYTTPPTGGLNQVSTTEPLSGGVFTGDIALGAFVQYESGTATAQAGWTELADLNATGSAAQLEVQKSPAATGNNQNFTAEVTWSQPSASIAGVLVLTSSLPIPIVSQVPLNVLAQNSSNQKARASQVPILVLAQNFPNEKAHASQVPILVLAQNLPVERARASQVAINLLMQVPIRASQVPVLTLGSNVPKARESQVCLLVLSTNLPGRRHALDDEWMMY